MPDSDHRSRNLIPPFLKTSVFYLWSNLGHTLDAPNTYYHCYDVPPNAKSGPGDVYSLFTSRAFCDFGINDSSGNVFYSSSLPIWTQLRLVLRSGSALLTSIPKHYIQVLLLLSFALRSLPSNADQSWTLLSKRTGLSKGFCGIAFTSK